MKFLELFYVFYERFYWFTFLFYLFIYLPVYTYLFLSSCVTTKIKYNNFCHYSARLVLSILSSYIKI